MRSLYRALVSAGAGAALLPALAGAAASHSPRSVALRTSDLPSGFTQTAAYTYTPAQADRKDGLPPGTLERHGRITGVETDFQHQGQVGLLDVSDSVVSFRSTAGAVWQLGYSTARAKARYSGAHFKPMGVGAIGDQAVGYTWQGMISGTELHTDLVFFRRGTYAVLVTGVSLPGQPSSQATIIHLAHVIDNRIRSAR